MKREGKRAREALLLLLLHLLPLNSSPASFVVLTRPTTHNNPQEGFAFSTGKRDGRVELEARRAAEMEMQIQNDAVGKRKEFTIDNIRRNIERRMVEYGLTPVKHGVSPRRSCTCLLPFVCGNEIA